MSPKSHTVALDDALALTPPGAIGWVEEFGNGDMPPAPENGVALRFVLNKGRLVLMASAEQREQARAFLVRLGIKPEAIRLVLCG